MAGAVVLVTGAAGFVGRQVVKPLELLGFRVIAPSQRDCDLLDPPQMRALLDATRPSHILHCAWEVTHGRFWAAPENLDWVAATLGLARHAARSGVRRFVGIGSCAEYDWADGGAADRTESDAARPDTLYGKAKLATATLLEAFCAEAGIGFAWARLFHLFGPGEHPARFVPSITRPLAEGKPALVRHGGLVRDMMRVEEAGAALAALVASELNGAMNIASGQGVTLGDFARQLTGDSPLLKVENLPAPGQPARMVADIGRLRGLRSDEA
jgi:nucleoside-diphosphate-sugar epimerase